MLSLLAAKDTPFQRFLCVSPSIHHALSAIVLSLYATDIKTKISSQSIRSRKKFYLTRSEALLIPLLQFSAFNECYHEALIGKRCGSSPVGELGLLFQQVGSIYEKCKIVARGLKVERPSRCPSLLGFDLIPPSMTKLLITCILLVKWSQ